MFRVVVKLHRFSIVFYFCGNNTELVARLMETQEMDHDCKEYKINVGCDIFATSKSGSRDKKSIGISRVEWWLQDEKGLLANYHSASLSYVRFTGM